MSLESERNYNNIASNEIIFSLFHKLVRKMGSHSGEELREMKVVFESIIELILDSPNGKNIGACFDIYFRTFDVENPNNRYIREGIMAISETHNQKFFSNYFELSSFSGKNNNFVFIPKIDLFDVTYDKTLNVKLNSFNFVLWLKNPEYSAFNKEFTLFSAAYIINGMNT